VIFVKPSKTFEATASGFTTGLVGTIGVRVVDGQGGTTIARTTSGIVESPAGSGVYTATLTSPSDVGQYEVVWDDAGSPTTWAAEDLTVTSSGAVPVTGSPGVGMTLEELLTEFYARGFDYLDDDGPGATRAKRWINQSYQEMCGMEDWPFLETSTTGTAPLTISDLGYIESVTNVSQDRSLNFIDRRTLVERYPDLTTAGSATYAYLTGGDTINTYPVGSDTLRVRYLRVVNDLDESTDQPVIPAKYQYAIIDYACGRAYMDSDNPEMAQIVRRDGDALVQQMREQFMVQQHQDTDIIVTYGYSSDFR
jgi:hypothetical protein